MIYTFDGNKVNAPTQDNGGSNASDEVIHTYEDFNEEEEDFAPVKKPGFFQSHRRASKIKPQDDATSKTLEEMNGSHGGFKDVDPNYQKSFLNAVNEIPTKSNSIFSKQDAPEQNESEDLGPAVNEAAFSTPVQSEPEDLGPAVNEAAFSTPVQNESEEDLGPAVNEDTFITPAMRAAQEETENESEEDLGPAVNEDAFITPAMRAAQEETENESEEDLGPAVNEDAFITPAMRSAQAAQEQEEKVFTFDTSEEDSNDSTSTTYTFDTPSEETTSDDNSSMVFDFSSSSEMEEPEEDHHVYDFDEEPEETSSVSYVEPVSSVSFSSSNPVESESPVEPESEPEVESDATPLESEYSFTTEPETESTDSSSDSEYTFTTEPEETSETASEEPAEEPVEAPSYSFTSEAETADDANAEAEEQAEEPAEDTFETSDISSENTFSSPETSTYTYSETETSSEDTYSEPEASTEDTYSEPEASTESNSSYSFDSADPTPVDEEVEEKETTSITSDDLAGDDILLSQIDEFKKNAIKLSGLMSQKQKEVSDLESVVSQKEEQNKQLTASLERARQDSAVIEDQLNSQVSKIIDSLNNSIGGMKNDFITAKEESDKNLLAQIETKGNLDEVKTEISDIIHNENVEQYRNLQKLISENNNSEEIMSSIKRYMKGMETKLSVAVAFSIINFLGIIGLILHMFGMF